MATFGVVVPAAGASSRFQGPGDKKPFVLLQGRPVWQRTVELFCNRDDVSQVVLVLAAEDVAPFRQRFAEQLKNLPLTIVTGGPTRADSVANGLEALDASVDFVAVHDAARPLLTQSDISDLFQAAVQFQAVIPAVPVTSTVKKVSEDARILATVDRSNLVLAQTPQVFRVELLKNAYARCSDPSVFTDEASLVEASGQTVYCHPGWPLNIKITTAEDLKLAEALLSLMP